MKIYDSQTEQRELTQEEKRELKNKIDAALNNMLAEKLAQVKHAVYNLSESEQMAFLETMNESRKEAQTKSSQKESQSRSKQANIIDDEIAAQILLALSEAKQNGQTTIISTQGLVTNKFLEKLEQLVNEESGDRTIIVYTTSAAVSG